MKTSHLSVCALVTTLSACSMDPVHVEQDFGNSVRQMIAGQISDPEAAVNPVPDAPDLLDGMSAEESLKGYRKDATRKDSAQREIRLSID
jgi:type IV pilus biogenesis protein CpaD/CtpE